MFQAFGPEIERLQDEKIVALAAHQTAHPGRDVFADRSLEILSRVEIDVRARVGAEASTIARGWKEETV
jgi:hypothetical protein